MYAVIESGGKQYKVAIGDRLRVEKLTAATGESVKLSRVLMVADGGQISLGADAAKKAVAATVVGHGRGAKIRVFKMKRRKDYRRTQGHRQSYTEIEITSIDGKTVKAAPKSAAKGAPKTAAKSAKKAAVKSTAAKTGKPAAKTAKKVAKKTAKKRV